MQQTYMQKIQQLIFIIFKLLQVLLKQKILKDTEDMVILKKWCLNRTLEYGSRWNVLPSPTLFKFQSISTNQYQYCLHFGRLVMP